MSIRGGAKWGGSSLDGNTPPLGTGLSTHQPAREKGNRGNQVLLALCEVVTGTAKAMQSILMSPGNLQKSHPSTPQPTLPPVPGPVKSETSVHDVFTEH